MTSFLQPPNWSIHTFLVHCFLGHSQHSSESNLSNMKTESRVGRYTPPRVEQIAWEGALWHKVLCDGLEGPDKGVGWTSGRRGSMYTYS